MVQQAKQALLHEIGHYLGIDEKRLRELGVG
jgi:predicted Zn-dependent protease with MMP-like domain